MKKLLAVLLAALLLCGGMAVGVSAETAFVTEAMLAGGSGHSLALKRDGTVWAWGGNSHGELGNNSYENSDLPVQVHFLNNVIAVDAGYGFSLAAKSDGTVWAWGENEYGLGGDANSTQSCVPLQVEGLDDVVSVSAGGSHCLALKSDGTVWAWGDNSSGQLGDGTTTNRSTPVKVLNVSGADYISAGAVHSLAGWERSGARAWGNNIHGQLGDGTFINRSKPVSVSSVSNIVALEAGLGSSFALTSAGNVFAWGNNYSGQLGDDSKINRAKPVVVRAPFGRYSVYGYFILSDAIAISANSCAVLKNGLIWDWSAGNFSARYVPNLSDIIDISSGLYHLLALRSDGMVFSSGMQVVGPEGIGWFNVFGIVGYYITYDANGGTSAPATETKIHDEDLALSYTMPVRLGYTFLGWADSAEAAVAQYQPGELFSLNADATLYAVWEALTYTVIYDANGGIGAPEPQTKTHDIMLILDKTTPTRSGHTFKGWAFSKTTGVPVFQPGSQYYNDTDTTLYAVWEKLPEPDPPRLLFSIWQWILKFIFFGWLWNR